jgi:multidrug efflux pump subunit AcrA (membrane-fusion protein)
MRLFVWLYDHWSDLVPLILTLLGLILAMVPTKVMELEKHPLWKFGLSAVLIIIGIAGTLQSVTKADKSEKDAQHARAEERQAQEEQKQARKEQREDAGNNKAFQRAMQDKLDKVLSNPKASRGQKQEASTLKQEITDLKTKQDKNLGIRNKLAHLLQQYNMLNTTICTPITVGPIGSGAGITPEACQELYGKLTSETVQYICDSGELEFADCVEFTETSAVPTEKVDALKRLIERYRK